MTLVWLDCLELYFQHMKKITIYGVALGTIVIGSGMIATSIADVTSPTCTPVSSPVPTNTVATTPPSTNNAGIEQSVHNQINQYRVSQGLPALTRNDAIDNQARIHSKNMANGTVAFGHTGFSQRVKAIGIPYSGAGENVAYNQGFSDPATKAVEGWLKSPGHLANIRGNYNKTGIGVAITSSGKVYLTQIFLR